MSDNGYCHSSTLSPLALDIGRLTSRPQLLTPGGMLKDSLSKETCALMARCISYLNDDSGILKEEKERKKKELSKHKKK